MPKCLATCAPTYSIRSENFSYVSWMLYRKEMLTWRRGEKLSSRLLSTLNRAHWSKLILKGNGRNMKLVGFCLITCFRLKIASNINTRNLLRVNHVHCCQGLLLSKQGCNYTLFSLSRERRKPSSINTLNQGFLCLGKDRKFGCNKILSTPPNILEKWL